jgi:hypothetical protein
MVAFVGDVHYAKGTYVGVVMQRAEDGKNNGKLQYTAINECVCVFEFARIHIHIHTPVFSYLVCLINMCFLLCL